MCMRMYVCVLGQSQCCESTPFPPKLPMGVIERLSCLEGKVDDLRHEHDSLSQTVQEAKTRSQGVYCSME